MIHHQSVPVGEPSPQYPGISATPESPAQPIAVLAYRSRAVRPQSERDLEQILVRARQRNRLEGITGLLVYDQGHFFQWLEGPRAALMRIWDAIRRSPLHCDIEILRDQTVPTRFFGSWDMRLARCERSGMGEVFAVADHPLRVLRRLRMSPTVLVDNAWDGVFADTVLPNLRLQHPGVLPGGTQAAAPRTTVGCAAGSAAKWHARPELVTALAALLLESDASATTRFLDELVGEGAALEPLFRELFEPAARCLGRWSDDDVCNELSVTAALGRLQIEAHRLSIQLDRAEPRVQRERTVLVASQPGESHCLGASLSSELFWRDGWNVRCEFPGDDRMLGNLVHDDWFDVLELSSSDAHCRDHQLNAMRASIRTAHLASKNPALAIIVDGRSFHEHPRAYLDVGADCGCSTSLDAVPAARRLLAALAAQTLPRSGGAAPAGAAPSADAGLSSVEKQLLTSLV